MAPSGEAAADRGGGRYRRYALALMIAAYACHSIDRQVIAVVLEPVKGEFRVSDRAMGLLGGLAYSLAFALTCLPLGWLIDRVNRSRLLAALLAVWSSLTLLCGLATGFVMLLAMRMGVGAAEAGGQPTCLSLIADYFEPKARSAAIGIFYLSSAIGIACSFLIGGFVAATWGWRAAFLVAGIPGMIVGLLIFATLREPRRGAFDARLADAAPVRAVLGRIGRTPALLHVIVAMTLASVTLQGMFLWVTSLLIRAHHVPLGRAGALIALAAGLSGVGTALAGWLADRRGRRGMAAQLQVPIATSLIAVPFGLALALTPSLPLAIACLMMSGLLTSAYLGPSYGMAMTLVPAGMRGTTAAVVQLVINLLGIGLGPLLTGTLSDSFGGGSRGLSLAMAATMLINLWAAFHYWCALRHARRHFASA